MARPLTISTVGTPTFDSSIKKFGSHSIFFPDPTSLPSEDYLTTADSAAWDSHGTIDCWIYRTINNAHLIVEQYQDVSNYFRVYVTGYAIIVEKNIAGSFTRYAYEGNSTVFALDTWHHLRFCFYTSGARTINFFLNGSRKTLDADGTALDYDNLSSSTTNFSAPLTIGGGTGFVGLTWKEFYLDELLITDTVLTDQSTASFTPPTSQYTAFDTYDADLLLHFNDNLTDDYPQQGSAVLHALNNFEATANPNPNMVFLGNDQYTWDDTNTWDEILNYHDRWLQPEIITASTDLTATATSAVFASTQLDCQFGIEIRGGVVLEASAELDVQFQNVIDGTAVRQDNPELDIAFTTDINAERLPGGSAELQSQFAISCQGNTTLGASAQLDTVLSLDCSARILKLASLFIDPLATLTVTGIVDIDGRAQLDTEFATAFKGGLLVQVDEPYDYTWDDPQSWDEFVLDRWGPQGFLAFNNIDLTAQGERLIDGSSVLDTVFDADLQGGLLQDGAADLDTAFQLTAEGKRIQPGECLMDTAFGISASAGLIINGLVLSQRDPKTVTEFGNVVISSTQAKFGLGSALITDTGDYFTVSGDSSLYNGNFTVELFLWGSNLTQTPNGTIWDNRISSANGMYLYVSYGSIGLYEGITGKGLTNAGFNNNQWNHIALVRNGTNAKVFVNGVQKISATVTTTNYSNRTTYIGAAYNGLVPMRGYFDEVRLSSSARYTGAFTPTTAAFINDDNTSALLHLDEDFLDDFTTGYKSKFRLDSQSDITRNATANLEDNFGFNISAIAVRQDTLELTIQTLLSAKAGIIHDAISSIDSQFTQSASADITRNAAANLSILAFQLADGISNPAIQAGVIRLDSEFGLEPFAGIIKDAGAELDLEFNQDVSAGRILDAACEMSVLGFQLTDGRISNVRGSAVLASSFEFTTIANVEVDGRATLQALGFVVSDGRLSDVRASATLSMSFDTRFEGDLRLLESGSVFKVLSETRTVTVNSEQRGLPVLPETRVLEIER